RTSRRDLLQRTLNQPRYPAPTACGALPELVGCCQTSLDRLDRRQLNLIRRRAGFGRVKDGAGRGGDDHSISEGQVTRLELPDGGVDLHPGKLREIAPGAEHGEIRRVRDYITQVEQVERAVVRDHRLILAHSEPGRKNVL